MSILDTLGDKALWKIREGTSNISLYNENFVTPEFAGFQKFENMSVRPALSWDHLPFNGMKETPQTTLKKNHAGTSVEPKMLSLDVLC